jgi:hypothetical protein
MKTSSRDVMRSSLPERQDPVERLKTTVILVTGADERFADLMFDALDSLRACGVLDQIQIGVLDFGLSTNRLRELPDLHPRSSSRTGHTLCRPNCGIDRSLA